MYPKTLELLVGAFVILGLLALGMLAIQVSGLSFASQKETYTVHAHFDELGGLAIRSRVSLAGVTIGRVSDINLDRDEYTAVVSLDIYSEVDNLTTDSIASIQTAGLLGEKFVSISVGADEEYLQDGDEIFDTQSSVNLEKIISAFASGQAEF